MEIRLPKPDITCPDCKSKDIYIYSDNNKIYCNDCDKDFEMVFEEDQTFCNFDLCKQLNKEDKNE